jgi:hypothetical protein
VTSTDLGGAGARCPVCGRAAGEQARCPKCGRELRTPWRAGRPDHAVRTEFEARLRAERLAYDARVVARITDELGPYDTCVRGGPPTARQWADARRAAAADVAGAGDDDALRARLRALLAALRPDTETTVTEVGPEGIAVLRLQLDQHGTPVTVQDGDIVNWSLLVPGLPATGPGRHFRLAAGAELARTDGQPGDPLALVARAAAEPGSQRIVICRPAGWEVLERTAGLLAARSGETPLRIAAGPDAEPVPAILAELAASGPLTRAYQLLVADIDDDSGAVRTRARQLFAPGDLPGARAWVPLRRLPGDYGTTMLAIFADGNAGEPLALYSAALPVNAPFQLAVSLGGPGRVQVSQPEAEPDNWTSWRRVRASLPERVDVTARPADLVCAVDLTGTEEAVQGRRQLVIGLLKQLAVEYPEPDRLRAAVITCRDHEYGPTEKDDVVSGCGLRPAGEAAAWLAAQPAEEPRYTGAAPVEDMLARAYQLLAASRAQRRAARVLTVAGKPPHPARQDAYAPSDMQRLHPCPHRADWRLSLAQLTREAGARCVTVSDAVHAIQAPSPVWRLLGPHGLHALSAATPRRLGEDLGLLIRPDQRIPLPVPDWK